MITIMSRIRACRTAALALFLLGAAGVQLQAEEPARQFLEALREQALFDLANYYLQQVENDPATPQEFRDTILFEQGLTLMAISRSESDFDSRQQRLDDAQKKFREFLTAHKNHDFAPKAKSQLANVLVERARVKIAEAERSKTPANKPALLKEARDFFEQALKEFEASQEGIAEKLESLPKTLDPQRDAKRIEYRDELRKDYVEVQMVQAVIMYEMSETAVEKKDKNELLKRAADKYGEIYTKYRRRLAGLYALLQQGKCYQEMGGEKNIQEALSFYQELLEQPEDPLPFRILRTKTLVQAIQAWLHEDLKEKKIDAAVLGGGEWVTKIRPNENRDADWLELHYETARAVHVKLQNMDENAPDRGNYLKEALRLVDHGIKYSDDPLKTKFLDLKAQLGGKIDTPDEKIDPKSFAEAYAAGVESWKSITSGQQQLEILKRAAEKEKDEAKKAELNQQVEDAKKAMVDSRFQAIEYFRKALGFVEEETSLDEVNFARFYLCSLHWTQQDYPEAAVYGEYLARYHAGHRTSKYTAIYARASYQNLYNIAKADEDAKADQLLAAEQEGAAEEDLARLQEELETAKSRTEFASNGVVRVSKLMLDKWPGEPEAEETLLVLIKFMVLQKNIDEARKYLEMVPAESKTRGEAEITTGQAMWSTYLSEMRPAREMETQIVELNRKIKAWEGGEEPPEGESIVAAKQKIGDLQGKIDNLTQQLNPLKIESQQTLKNGIERMQQAEIDKTLAAAVATLCRIYVEADQAQDAIALMEDPKIGALTLVKQDHEAVQREGMASEVYTTALLAYFAALPDAANTQELYGKAEAAMDGLNNTVGNDAAGQEKLISIYVTLAKDIADMRSRAPAAKRKVLTQVFGTFLERVVQTSSDVPVLSWAATNFYTLGTEAETPSGGITEEAKKYYAKAADQYQALIDKSGKDEKVTDQMLVFLRGQLATVLRKQGEYVLAMDQMEEILKDPKRNMTLDLQIEAANTYMDWAASDIGIDRLYMRAINGGRKTSAKKNNIWGWVKIGKILAAQVQKPGIDEAVKAEYYEKMHLAKIMQARCNYEYALTAEGDEREKYLKYAKQDIRLAAQSFPDLGGDVQRKEYDDLLKEIQTALSETPDGLAAFDTAAVASADGTSEGGGGE